MPKGRVLFLRKFFTYDAARPSNFIYATLLVFSSSLILFGVICSPLRELSTGFMAILTTSATLITDSISIGGMGAAFVNSGIVTLFSVLLVRWLKVPFSGMSIACMSLMAGFSLFGKDIINILPILLGTRLFAFVKKEPFSHYAYMSLFGTCLSPVVTEMGLLAEGNPLVQFILVISIGVFIGFILPPIATYSLQLHQGYNLYNVGFAAGLIGLVLASVFRSFGYRFETRLEWSSGNNLSLSIFLFSLFAIMIITGWVLNGKSFSGFSRIFRHTGRAVADFVLLDSYPIVLINMGIIGSVAALYVLLAGGALCGPTIGGIFAVCGFGAFGKHLRNILPIMLGVIVSSFLMVWNLHDPSVLLAALFSTGLAPIAGRFGWKVGFLAGALHASVVLNVTILQGGLNLYNNGFAAGLVCIVLLPLIEAFRKDKSL